jgi:hypothetical protein
MSLLSGAMSITLPKLSVTSRTMWIGLLVTRCSYGRVPRHLT